MPSSVPERLSWAVEQLALEPDERVLEIGCGRGVAIELVCRVLTDGRITAIDRSPTATAAARHRNAEHIREGRAVVHTVALHEVNLPDDTFDKVFAVNVNLFWTSDAQAELEQIRRMLRVDGSLHLFYEPPSHDRADSLIRETTEHLTEAGFSSDVSRRGLLVHIAARPWPDGDRTTQVG